MEVFELKSELTEYLHAARQQQRRLALVPTMGNLHAGHLSLIDTALANSEVVVATIFVNPLQFGPDEDLDAYPRSLERDIELLQQRGCHCLFAPSASEIYGESQQTQTRVQVPGISEAYCGASRPGHFDGVSTIVAKLFNLMQPDCAVFGLKDYQQYLVIKKMTADLLMPIEIIGAEIVREDSGLAMSSRNNYLSDSEKQQATILNSTLRSVSERISAGDSDYPRLEAEAAQRINQAGLRSDYFSVCNAETLQAASTEDESLIVLAAAYLGDTRLIDNVRFTLDGAR